MSYGDFFREARERLGLTQGEAAAKAGLSSGQIVSNYERDVKLPEGIDALVRLAKAYGITVDELLGWPTRTRGDSAEALRYAAQYLHGQAAAISADPKPTSSGGRRPVREGEGKRAAQTARAKPSAHGPSAAEPLEPKRGKAGGSR